MVDAAEPLDEMVIRIETRIEELEDDMRRAERIVSDTTRNIDTQTRQAGEGFVTINQAMARAAIIASGVVLAIKAIGPALDTARDLTIAFGFAAGNVENAFERIERRLGPFNRGVDAMLLNLRNAQRGIDTPFGEIKIPEFGGPLGFVQRAIQKVTLDQELDLQQTLRAGVEGERQRGIDARRRLQVERGEIPESVIPEREFERAKLALGNALLEIFDTFTKAGVDPVFARQELAAAGRLGTAALAAQRDLALEGIEQDRLARDPFQRFQTPFGRAAFATPQLGAEFISAAEQRRDAERARQTVLQEKIERNTRGAFANVFR